MNRFLTGISVSATLCALCLFAPLNEVTAQEVASPGPDETLIYVLRKGRFVGGGAKVWIAVNDQTVARVKNKGYAVVRAKAGAITLNLASQGMVLAATAVDDRPGETVYLRWRLGDELFTELDEAEGREFIRKAKQTKPVERPGNNEQIDALLNLTRLGFDLMRPATQQLSPDSEHAVLTVFRRKEGKKLNFGLWGEDRFIGTLGANEGIEILLTPGEHYFLSGHVGTTLLKARVEAGKRYYALIDVGNIVLRVKMKPVGAEQSDKLNDWLDDVEIIELALDAVTPRVQEREKLVAEFVQSVADKARNGQMDFTDLNSEHAH